MRIQRAKWEGLGWIELAGVELVAAAGVREQPSMVLEGTGGGASGSCRFVEAR